MSKHRELLETEFYDYNYNHYTAYCQKKMKEERLEEYLRIRTNFIKLAIKEGILEQVDEITYRHKENGRLVVMM
jgi:hypothetical protein